MGLRTAEVCGLKVDHVDFTRGIVHPTAQYPEDLPKSEAARTPLPIAQELVLELSSAVAAAGGDYVVANGRGGQVTPRTIDRVMRDARAAVSDLPGGFRSHDLRHYSASLLVGSGLDVKVVQHRLRHASATTLNVYSHLWPDSDESARAAVSAVLAARADSLRTG